MTALAYILQPDQVCVAMDTLVIRHTDKKPIGFQRKFLSLPESNLVIAGTGQAGFINGWFDFVSKNFFRSDLENINIITPDILYRSSKATTESKEITATLYHFGYSMTEGEYVGYAYRSTSCFQSERLQFGLGIKPSVDIESTEINDVPNFLIDIIQKQQRQDKLLPIEKQVGIGGEIDFIELKNNKTNSQTIHRFSNYENDKVQVERFIET